MPTAADYLADAAWKKKWDDLFHVFDANKNGVIQLVDILIIIDRYRANATCSPEHLDALKAVLLEFATAVGIANDKTKLDKTVWLQNAAAFCVTEAAKLQKGEETIFHKVDNASFDVVDKNRDGYISWEEFQVVMKAWNLEDAARAAFDNFDKNKDGKLSRKEYIESDVKYFYELGDQKRMFGGKF